MTSNEYVEIDYEEAVDNYEEEIVLYALTLFIEETYNDLKKKIPIFYKEKNYKEIFAYVHKFKTTTRYIGAMNFSNVCNDIQNCCGEKNLNIEKLDKLYSIFINNLDPLYVECKKIYDEKIKKNNDNNDDNNEKKVDDNNNENNKETNNENNKEKNEENNKEKNDEKNKENNKENNNENENEN